MTKINVLHTLGEIVAAQPEASAVFKRYGIDFCCGGNRPLAEAIKEQGLSEEELLKALEEAGCKAKEQVSKEDFRVMASSRLIEYLDLSRPVHDLCKENPSMVEVLKELGFDQITNPAMLNTAGRFMTIPKGAVMKGVELGRIKRELEKRGFILI